MTVGQKVIDYIAAPIINFLADLHNCHKCGYRLSLINGKGKDRTKCGKYDMHISRVRDNCIDRFVGITMDEMKEIARQYIAGTCKIGIEGF